MNPVFVNNNKVINSYLHKMDLKILKTSLDRKWKTLYGIVWIVDRFQGVQRWKQLANGRTGLQIIRID